MTFKKPRLLISACFLATPVRYDGKHNALTYEQLTLLRQHYQLVSICPEVCGGLSIPREPAEQQLNGRVMTQSGIDVSEAFYFGAEHALNLCKTHNISTALLKESSPSCGSHFIYDGSFSHRKIAGQGLTARLLTANGIKVYSELNWQQLLKS